MQEQSDHHVARRPRGRRPLAGGIALLVAMTFGIVGLATSPALADGAPDLKLTTTNSAANPVAGNTSFQYTVALKNTGGSTALQIANLIVTLPTDVKYVSLSSITVSGGVTPPGVNIPPTYTPAGNGFGGTLTFSNVQNIPTNGSISITFNAQVAPTPLAGQTEIDTAAIASYSDQPTGTPGTTYGPLQAQGRVQVTGNSLSTSAAVLTPRANGIGGVATIGDQVRYTTTYTIPNNVRLADGFVSQCLPLGFHLVAGSYVATTTGGSIPGFASPNTIGSGNLDTQATDTHGVCRSDQQYVKISLPGFTNSGPAITLQVALTARITGKDNTGTDVFLTYPGANSTNSAAAANDNDAYVFNSGSANATAQSGALSGSANGGNAVNGVYVPHLDLTASLARPASPAAGGTTVDFLVSLANTGGSPAHQVGDLAISLADGITPVGVYESDATCQVTTPAADVTRDGQEFSLTASSTPLAAGSARHLCVRGQLDADVSAETSYAVTARLADGAGNGPQYDSAPTTFTGRAFSDVDDASASIDTPPSADLSITKTDGVTTATPGGSVTYTITASNAGPSNVTGAIVSDDLPDELGGSWTCVGSHGATCGASGSGDIDDRADLPDGGSVTYTLTAAIATTATSTLSNTATVTPPNGVIDPDPNNNSATDTDTLLTLSTTTATASAASVTVGEPVTVAATVTGTSPTGTVTFAACGPLATATQCTAGGTPVGDPQTLAAGSATSDPLTLTAPGIYCFRAEYSGDSANAPSSDTAEAQCVTAVQSAPVVTTDPADQNVGVGTDAEFTASATGRPAPTVQWQVDDGTGWSDLPGATSTTLTVRSVKLSEDTFRYRAQFHNRAGDITTEAATLHVRAQRPAVRTQPMDSTVRSGHRATFRATATGNPTPTVRWQERVAETWRDIAGATSSELVLARPGLALDGRRYRAVFTNTAGSVATAAVTLHVTGRPRFTTSPRAVFRTGKHKTFRIHATGTPTPSVSVRGARPPGLHLKIGRDGTATLRGRATRPGRYLLTMSARNGKMSVQNLVVIVERGPRR